MSIVDAMRPRDTIASELVIWAYKRRQTCAQIDDLSSWQDNGGGGSRPLRTIGVRDLKRKVVLILAGPCKPGD